MRSEDPTFSPPKLSDHSMILTTAKPFDTSNDDGKIDENGSTVKEKVGNPRPKRFRVDGVKDGFMSSPARAEELMRLCDELIKLKSTQDEINKWYDAFIAVYHAEMCKFYKLIEDTPKSKKNFHISRKGWWCDELGEQAKKTHRAERLYLRLVKEHKGYEGAKKQFLTHQQTFDRMVKRYKRKWQRNQVMGLEEANLTNPTEFWNFIKNMRKNKKASITMEVYIDENNSATTDEPAEVMDRWARDFGSLLTPPVKNETEQLFVEQIRNKNRMFEHNMCFGPSTFLNREISISHVKKVVFKAKNQKAPGYDSLTYEVLKNDNSVIALTKLFNKCLIEGMVPSTWVKGIINPIPKSASSDLRVPLNYRGSVCCLSSVSSTQPFCLVE